MIPAPIRRQARDAVARAWAAAIDTGALPPLPDERRGPPSRSSGRPPPHGDLATNLAMKLARPYRRGPAGSLRPCWPRSWSGTPRERLGVTDRGGRGRSARVHQPPAADRALWPRSSTAILAEPRGLGSGRAGRAARGQRRVRLGQPDRPAHDRQRARRLHRRPAQPRPRGRRPGRDARVLLQRLRGADPQPRARRSRPSGAASRCPRRATRATTSPTSRRRSPTRSGRRRPPTARTPAAILGPWAAGRVRAGIEASLGQPRACTSMSGPARAACTTRAGSSARSSDCASAATSTSRTARLWFRSTAFGDDKDRVIYRSDGRADLLRRRHRLRDREVQPRLRPPHLHLGRRSPRHGGPRPQRRGGDGLRPRGRPGAARIPGSASCATAWRSRCSKRAGEFITLDELLAEVGVDAARWFFASRGHTSAIDFDIELAKKQIEREPGLLRPVRARPDRLDPAQGGGRRARAGDLGRRRARRGGPRRALARAIVRLPEVVEDAVAAEETQGITAYATELATAFHAFYRDARVVDRRGAGAVGGAPGRSRARRRSRSRNTLGLLGISRAGVDVAGGAARVRSLAGVARQSAAPAIDCSARRRCRRRPTDRAARSPG